MREKEGSKWWRDLGKGGHLSTPAKQTGQLQVTDGWNSIKS